MANKEKSSKWLRDIATAPIEEVRTIATAIYVTDPKGALRKHRIATLYAVQYKKANEPIPEYLRLVLKTIGDIDSSNILFRKGAPCGS